MDILNDFIPKDVNASVGRRYLGALIDYIIYIVIYSVCLYALGNAAIDEEGDTMYALTGAAAFFIIVGSWFLIFPVIEAINNGQTIGKAIVGVRVKKMNGEKAGFGRLLVRHLFDFVDYMPFFGIVGVIVAANTDNKQRVGDLVAQTIVVSSR
jgi:uncharacterized RDD family membrane protein YckC